MSSETDSSCTAFHCVPGLDSAFHLSVCVHVTYWGRGFKHGDWLQFSELKGQRRWSLSYVRPNGGDGSYFTTFTGVCDGAGSDRGNSVNVFRQAFPLLLLMPVNHQCGLLLSFANLVSQSAGFVLYTTTRQCRRWVTERSSTQCTSKCISQNQPIMNAGLFCIFRQYCKKQKWLVPLVGCVTANKTAFSFKMVLFFLFSLTTLWGFHFSVNFTTQNTQKIR